MQRIKVKVYDNADILLSALLVCCAWGKVGWLWFWLVLCITVAASDSWSSDKIE